MSSYTECHVILYKMAFIPLGWKESIIYSLLGENAFHYFKL